MNSRRDDWREEFEKKFIYKTKPVGAQYNIKYFKGESTPVQVLQFIEQAIAKSREKVIAEIIVDVDKTKKGMFPDNSNLTMNNLLTRIKALQSLKQKK